MDRQPKTSPDPADFADIREWVFDLDNTLYPHHINLFAQIDKNMTAYVQELLQLEPEDARAAEALLPRARNDTAGPDAEPRHRS